MKKRTGVRFTSFVKKEATIGEGTAGRKNREDIKRQREQRQALVDKFKKRSDNA